MTRRDIRPGDAFATPAALPLIQAAHSVFEPHKIVLGTRGEVEPFARTIPSTVAPLAYVCTATSCQPPTADPETIRNLLRA